MLLGGGKGHGPRICGTSKAAFFQDGNRDFDSDFGFPVIDELDVEDAGLLVLPGESLLVCPDGTHDKIQCNELRTVILLPHATRHTRKTLFKISR